MTDTTANTSAAGTDEAEVRSGWMTFSVLAMRQKWRSVDMPDGELMTALTRRMFRYRAQMALSVNMQVRI